MARRGRASNTIPKKDYFTRLREGTSHPVYDPNVEGYGSVTEWASTFNVRMGFDEAKEYKASGTKRKAWKSDWAVLSEIAGIYLDENSMWSEIKSAFRKAAMNCHPDRVTQHGMPKEQAEETFKDASAAYAMLEDRYNMQGRRK
jgi:DnaJ domain